VLGEVGGYGSDIDRGENIYNKLDFSKRAV